MQSHRHIPAVTPAAIELRDLRFGREVPLPVWAAEILDAMQGVCEILDSASGTDQYVQALRRQRDKVDLPELTPSARMLHEMRGNGESFYEFARRMSVEHRRYFSQSLLSPERERFLTEAARQSLRRQAEVDAADERSFAEFLEDYFRQGDPPIAGQS